MGIFSKAITRPLSVICCISMVASFASGSRFDAPSMQSASAAGNNPKVTFWKGSSVLKYPYYSNGERKSHIAAEPETDADWISAIQFEMEATGDFRVQHIAASLLSLQTCWYVSVSALTL
jgi:hypothetical protein